MRFPRSTKIVRGQLDAAPFAAVFFLLVIFLLLKSSIVFTPGVPIALPESVNLPGTTNATIVVGVDSGGNYYYRSQITGEENLKQELLAEKSRLQDPVTLIIQADKEVKYEILVRLALLARHVGIDQALLATRPRLVPAAR